MKKEAASAGVLDTPFGKFARLQILTIEDLFASKKPAMPPEDAASPLTAGCVSFFRNVECVMWEISVEIPTSACRPRGTSRVRRTARLAS